MGDQRVTAMKKFGFAVLAAVFFLGCTESGTELESTDSSVQPKSAETTSPPSQETASPSSNDAQGLLASAMASAQADDKRVMVHLGAPW